MGKTDIGESQTGEKPDSGESQIVREIRQQGKPDSGENPYSGGNQIDQIVVNNRYCGNPYDGGNQIWGKPDSGENQTVGKSYSEGKQIWGKPDSGGNQTVANSAISAKGRFCCRF